MKSKVFTEIMKKSLFIYKKNIRFCYVEQNIQSISKISNLENKLAIFENLIKKNEEIINNFDFEKTEEEEINNFSKEINKLGFFQDKIEKIEENNEFKGIYYIYIFFYK